VWPTLAVLGAARLARGGPSQALLVAIACVPLPACDTPLSRELEARRTQTSAEQTHREEAAARDSAAVTRLSKEAAGQAEKVQSLVDAMRVERDEIKQKLLRAQLDAAYVEQTETLAKQGKAPPPRPSALDAPKAPCKCNVGDVLCDCL